MCRIQTLSILVAILFCSATIVWFSIDNGYPAWDAANHTLAANEYSRLLKHAHPLNVQWWKHFLQVDPAYPLTVNLSYGFFRFLFGERSISDGCCAAALWLLLSRSIYGIVRLMKQSQITACLSVAIINLFPLVCALSHTLLLDFGVLCYVTFSYWRLLCWYQEPSRKNYLLAAVSFMLAVTSKQAASFYFIGPFAILFFRFLRSADRRSLFQLIGLGASGALALSFWVVPNFKVIKRIREVCQDECSNGGSRLELFARHITEYSLGIIQMVSPLWAIVALCSLLICFRALREVRLERNILLSGYLTGIVCLSIMAVSRPETRYVIPLAVPVAIASAIFVARLFDLNLLGKIVGFALLATGFGQYLIFNFAPYPLSLPPAETTKIKSLIMKENSETLMAVPTNPTPPGDLYAQRWLVNFCYGLQKDRPTRVTLLANTAELNVHTLEVVASELRRPVEFSTCRKFTLNGDVIELTPGQIAYYDCFVVKTGNDTGFKVADSTSMASLEKAKIMLKSNEFIANNHSINGDGTSLIVYTKAAAATK